MQRFLTIWRREIMACFLSPVAYVTMVAFLAATGSTFWYAAFRNVGRPDPLSLLLAGSIVFWLPILITVIGMRLFAEEKRAGTLETLMTAPVTEAEVVAGKFAGAFTFLLLVTAPAFADMFILERLSPSLTMDNIDLGAIAGAGVILVLVTASFLSVAMVVSLLTRNQIVAAICTFAALWMVLLGGWVLAETPGVPESLAAYISVTRHLEDFSRGAVDARPAVLHLTLAALMLFVSTRVLESRRWK